MVLLRFGALARMMILRTFLIEKNLTQHQLDSVYRLENMQYGWEFPTQLLVVVIVFTYAVICPVILPFGLVYFLVALVVYKKQILYVYSPIYESGGAMFPMVLQHTLFGLVCGQTTFLGYVWTRGCYYEPIALLPLPIMTVLVMRQFQETFADPSALLSLELARDYDRKSNLQACKEEQGILLLEEGVEASECGIESRRQSFDKKSYRQPVLTELPSKPWRYRRGQEDEETMTVRNRLHQINRFTIGMSREENDDGNDTKRMDLQDMMSSDRRLVE
jgi:Calcium-dependent channel, 7TM region, putative phosphate